MSVIESRKFISCCLEPGVSPELVYVHKYKPGDVVIWDDRIVLHSTSPIKEHEDDYGTGGLVGQRLIQRIRSLSAASAKWGKDSDQGSASDSDSDADTDDEAF